MAVYLNKSYTKDELLKKVGSIHAIAGIKKIEYTEGMGKGYEAVEFRTGTGFSFVVGLSRCMDIIQAEYCGKPLNWKCSCEEVSPQYYDCNSTNWLYSFAGGLTATCGLMNVGEPCTYLDEEKGMHGRVGNIPAYNVCLQEKWDGDDFIMSVKGIMRETRLFGANYTLERKIWTKLGENKIYMEDTIINEAHIPQPLEILYHCNLGFPFVDKGSYLVVPSNKVEGRSPKAKANIESWDKLTEPQYNFEEECFFHDMKVINGFATVALINPNLKMGLTIKYNKEELPFLTEWKCMDEGQYVLGFEPANCHVMGMAWEGKNSTLEYMEPGQVKKNSLTFSVLDGIEEIKNCESYLRRL